MAKPLFDVDTTQAQMHCEEKRRREESEMMVKRDKVERDRKWDKDTMDLASLGLAQLPTCCIHFSSEGLLQDISWFYSAPFNI